ncbi:regucalcin-like [Danaus plexippus]|uniref:Regucalcin n=1 Tax=Danaus plexippus plexippus TaxID=278856 RepID=A0A212FHT2_DANPL|nr:regucalcin-like [Danaus plexippus]XP_032516926.1 regucalcin-like [Danaus plexippus plexippus]XP_032516927.1 regucalcin-like [Danaus plexippus]OWR53293.1 Luciferin regenerating enzyme [Danaus plexippus plexippus]
MPLKIEKITDPLTLGEGPHWDDRQQALLFVDILACTIHKYVLSSKKHTKTKLDGRPGFIVPVEGETDQYIIGLELSFVIIQWDGEEGSPAKVLRTLADVDQDVSPKPRINDGKADPRGRIFAGSIGYENPPGKFSPKQCSLYRLDKSEVKKVCGDITVSNGLAWDLERKAFYYIDSMDLKIRRYDYDVDSGDVSNMKYIFDLQANGVEGFPDGATIDSDGNLWVAVFSGSCVLQVDPVRGTLIQKLAIPASQVTSVTFGGPDFDVMFVTSASVDYTGPQEPPGGCTFMITGVGAKGLPNVCYKLQ